MFVDSDDWVHPDFCILPYEAAIENKADLVIFSYYSIACLRKKRHKIKLCGQISREEALDAGEPCAWNKLYRKSLFDVIRYPEGHNYEDVATTHKLIYRSDNIYIINHCLYYYVDRSDSITNTFTDKNMNDWYDARTQRQEFLATNGYPADKLWLYNQATAFIYCIKMWPNDGERYIKARTLLNKTDHLSSSFSFRIRIMFYIWKHDKKLFHFICQITRKRISRKY